jgi:hypothetical protein
MLKVNYPEIFDTIADWAIKSLTKYYIFKKEPEKVKKVINHLIKNQKDDPDIIFEILDCLIINEYIQEAEDLIQSYYKFFEETKSMIPSGLFELTYLQSIFIISKTKKENIKEELKTIDYTQEEKILNKRIDILRNKEYKSQNWNLNDFKKKEKNINLYFLTLEFGRALQKEHNPVTAHYLQKTIYEYYAEIDINDFKFKKEKTEELLVSYINLFSIAVTRAFIIIYTIELFYKFLRKKNLINEEAFSSSIKDIKYLSEELNKKFKEEIWKYNFTKKNI